MDLTKVNPILGYEMYSKADRTLMNKRSDYHDHPLSEQVQSITKHLCTI
jgi:hypothetical protein